MAWLSLTRMSKKYSIPVNDIKKKLKAKKIIKISKTHKTLPTDLGISEEYIKVKDGNYGEYLVYDSSKIDVFFSKKVDDLLFIDTYKKAIKNLVSIHKRIKKEELYMHTFVHEVIRLISTLEDELENNEKITKIDRKRIILNIDYLNNNATFQNLEDGLIF